MEGDQSMKVKNRQVVALWNVISKYSEMETKLIRFKYALAKNKRALTDQVEILKEAQTPGEKFRTYDTERLGLCQAYAQKDDEGNPKIEGNQFVMDNLVEFNEKLAKLQEKHEEAIEENSQQIKDFEKLLDEEVELPLFQIKFEDLPQDMDARDMEIMLDLIDDAAAS